MTNRRIITYCDNSEDLYLYVFFNDETFEFSLMEGVNVYNPAFDVTEAKNITAIITERGVIKSHDTAAIAEHLGS